MLQRHQKAERLVDPTAPISSYERDDTRFELHCLCTRHDIAAIAPEWRKLEARCAHSFIPFQCVDWCMAWLDNEETLAEENAPVPAVYTLRKNGQLALVWPLTTQRNRIGLRLLMNLTAPFAQYSNVILDNDAVPSSVLSESLNDAVAHSQCDAILVDRCPETSPINGFATKRGITEYGQTCSSVLDLSSAGTWEECRAALPKRIRRRRNQRRNKLAKHGELTFKVHEGGSDEFRELVRQALIMKEEWLQQTGRTSSQLSRTETLGFLSGLPAMTKPSEIGILAHALYCDGRPIAIELGYRVKDYYCAYMGAFDWAWRDLSPGKTQMEYSQQWAVESGIASYDLLGEMSDYKALWTNMTVPLTSRAIPLSVLGFVYCVSWRVTLRPFAKWLLGKLGPNARRAVLGVLKPQHANSVKLLHDKAA